MGVVTPSPNKKKNRRSGGQVVINDDIPIDCMFPGFICFVFMDHLRITAI